MTSPWAPPEPARGPRTRSEVSAAGDQVPQRGRAALYARGIAIAVLLGGIGSWALFFYGVVTLLLAVFFMPIAAALAGLTLAGAAAGGVLLLAAAKRHQADGWVLTTVLLLTGAGLAAWLLDGMFQAPQRTYDMQQRRAATAERLLPADAAPIEVVQYAHRIREQPELQDDVVAPTLALCGLLAPPYRDGCNRSAGDPPLEPPTYEIVRNEGDRLIVTWIESPFGDRAAVRLERGERGWELIDVPGGFGDECVAQALATGYEAWSCPPAG